MSALDDLYARLPTPIQNLSISLYGIYWHRLRFGGKYKQFRIGYQNREHWSTKEWEEYQRQKLQELIKIAYDKVPYYRSRWSQEQVAAALSGDLRALPLLDKEPLRSNPMDFMREDQSDKRHWSFSTSGSTGTPISTKWLASELQDSLAVREVRSANWAGVSYKLPRATFSGRMVEPDPNSKGPYYRYNTAEKQVYFSPFHLSLDTADFYVSAITKHKIQWMTGYAVSFYLLAKYILEKDLKVQGLKAIITTSEKLTREMRSVMEKAYSCKIYEEYSTVENVVFASECECGRLHVSPDVGIVEILRPDGTPCAAGEPGEVVATCLMRSFQPFIRFRLGDMAAWEESPCPCGRSMPVLKEVIGRIEDIVTGPDGRQMVRFHGIFTNQPNIIEGQIIQESLLEINVNVVAASSYSQRDTDEIVRRIQQRLGNEVMVKVNIVQKIPRLPSGKFQAVISKVKA